MQPVSTDSPDRFDGLFYAISDLMVQLNGKIDRRERAWPAPRFEEGCPASIDDVDRAQVQLAAVDCFARLANVAMSKVGFLLVGERASAAKSSTATTFATASS